LQKNKQPEKTITILNPIKKNIVGVLPVHTSKQIEEKIHLAEESFRSWSMKTISERLRELKKFRKFLAKYKEEMISRICEETGKTKMDGLIEVFQTCNHLKYLENNSNQILRKKSRNSGFFFYKKSYIQYQPYGLVGVISENNNPLFTSVIPIFNALICGNTVILKPSENSPYTALKVLDFFHRAQITDGILQVVIGKKWTTDFLVKSKNTKMIFYTGNTEDGKEIAKSCAGDLKPTVLNLSSKNPLIVFRDADLLRAARASLWAAFSNLGQSNTSIERVYVEKSIFNEFVHLIKEEYSRIKNSNQKDFPSFEKINLDRNSNNRDMHYKDAKSKKAFFIEDGVVSPKEHLPTIIISTNHKMKIMKEETQAPTLSIMEFNTIEESIKLANDSDFGSFASIWTNDVDKADLIAKNLDYGSVSINDVVSNIWISDLPVGGFKNSGLGKMNSNEGLLSFTKLQSVSTNKSYWKISDELWWFPYSKKIYSYLSRIIEFLFG
jgi:acyl-CoA reductase-like NAD-dependent aldehyde dehydrogenase